MSRNQPLFPLWSKQTVLLLPLLLNVSSAAWRGNVVAALVLTVFSVNNKTEGSRCHASFYLLAWNSIWVLSLNAPPPRALLRVQLVERAVHAHRGVQVVQASVLTDRSHVAYTPAALSHPSITEATGVCWFDMTLRTNINIWHKGSHSLKRKRRVHLPWEAL